MQLTFNSTSELSDFLEFACTLGTRVLGAQAPVDNVQLPVNDGRVWFDWHGGDCPLDVAREVHADGSVTTTSIGLPPDAGAVTGAPTEAQKPARKRRTKAEIAAAEAAGSPDSQPQASSDAGAQQALEPAHGANPFAAATGNIAQDVQTALAGGAQTNQTLAQVAASQVAITVPGSDPVVAIPMRAEQIGKLDAIEHMRRAREFIAAKGQQTYQRTFALAGLSANVMSYSPEQCATHLAAMEWLAANPEA